MRLTFKNPEGTWGMINGFDMKKVPTGLYGALWKLKEYEELGEPFEIYQKKLELEDYKALGLSPEELRNVDALYLKKCIEVNILKQQKQEKTNADHIRNMSDQELAEFLIGVEYETQRGGLWMDKERCLEWLKGKRA